MNTGIRQLSVWLAAIATIVINILANVLPINGQLTGEISDRFAVYFVPAGYVFSIWGLIYIGIIAYAVYQSLPSQRANVRVQRIAPLFVLSSVANSAWIFLWHYEQFVLSVVAMAVLLASLIGIYLQLGIGRTAVDRRQRWLVHVPFSIYLGWITVATVANVTATLSYLNWNGAGISPEAWAVVMLVVAAAVATAVSLQRGDAAYIAVIVWAFVGIAVKHSATPVVAVPALALAALVALSLWVGIPRLRRSGTHRYAM